jgi:xylulokinase
MRIQALDLLLEKLSRDCPDPALLSRIRCISGAGQVSPASHFSPKSERAKLTFSSPSSSSHDEKQPSTLHFLTPMFPSLLSRLSHSPESRLSSILTSTAAFSHPTPSTASDSSTTSQVRALESYFGRRALSIPSASEGGGGIVPTNPHLVLAAGRKELAKRTGSKPSTRGGVAQLIKIREEDARESEGGRLRPGLLDGERTGRIVLEGGLFAACFLGRYVDSSSSLSLLPRSNLKSASSHPSLADVPAFSRFSLLLLHYSLPPTDAADACCTGLFDPVTQDWDDDVLEYVKTGGGEAGEGARALREVLGDVEADGGVEVRLAFFSGASFHFGRQNRGHLADDCGELILPSSKQLGKISPYFVHRFGFSPGASLFLPFFSLLSRAYSNAHLPSRRLHYRPLLRLVSLHLPLLPPLQLSLASLKDPRGLARRSPLPFDLR